jgi:hypothetical protein
MSASETLATTTQRRGLPPACGYRARWLVVAGQVCQWCSHRPADGWSGSARCDWRQVPDRSSSADGRTISTVPALLGLNLSSRFAPVRLTRLSLHSRIAARTRLFESSCKAATQPPLFGSVRSLIGRNARCLTPGAHETHKPARAQQVLRNERCSREWPIPCHNPPPTPAHDLPVRPAG